MMLDCFPLCVVMSTTGPGSIRVKALLRGSFFMGASVVACVRVETQIRNTAAETATRNLITDYFSAADAAVAHESEVRSLVSEVRWRFYMGRDAL